MLTFVTGQIHWEDPGNYANGIIMRETGLRACKPRQLLHLPNVKLFSLHLSSVTWGLQDFDTRSSVWIQQELPQEGRPRCCAAGSCGALRLSEETDTQIIPNMACVHLVSMSVSCT